MEENTTKNIIKFGVSSDLTKRVEPYRTSNPYCKLFFLIYSNDSILLETNIKKKYEKQLYASNSECVIDIQDEKIISDVKMICELLDIEYTEETDEEIQKFNRNIIPIDQAEIELQDEDEKVVEIDTQKMKRCGGIHHTTEQSRMKPITDFFKNKGNRDGVNRLCKECYLRGRYGDNRKQRKIVVIPPYDILTHKWCNRCESVKERKNFYNDKQSKDGLGANCKNCKADQKKEYIKRKEEEKKNKALEEIL